MNRRVLFRGFLLLWLLSPKLATSAANANLQTNWLALENFRQLPVIRPRVAAGDWLVHRTNLKAAIFRSATEPEILLDNGLIQRRFRVRPNVATLRLDLLTTHTTLLRGVKPEALVCLDGNTNRIGGLLGQPDYAYLLPEWIARLTNDPSAFQCVAIRSGPTEARFAWKRRRRCANLPWPPPGAALRFEYRGVAPSVRSIEVAVHYELYDGLPVYAKWITVRNRGAQPRRLNAFASEMLAAVEAESAVDERDPRHWRLPPFQLLSDYSFHGMDAVTADQISHWDPDPQYTTQVNYNLKTPALLVSRPPIGPDWILSPGEQFESYRTFVVIYDSDSRERQGLILRRAQRALAPWVAENPIMMHVRSAESKVFRRAVDQCADVGFEMIIYTFGSGLDMEDEDPSYLARVKADVDYAHSKGIEVGAYSLLASRHIDSQNDVINPATGKPGGAIFGYSPCLGSDWGRQYFARIKHFIEAAGLDLLEHDGSYPGDVCASTRHPGHRGLKDSQWAQWKIISGFYQWCRARGVYLNVPDYYFLAGSSKTGMGYRESNWSLPRMQQILHGRQNIYDGTWTKTPSMGWTFVPLVEYQGGGAAATLEPLRLHLGAYEMHLANNLGAGVQACFRGPRLFDAPETEALLKKWVAWFKQHRAILESDIIHLRRADGRDYDGWLHVNPDLEEKGMAVLYNPLPVPIRRTIRLPLHYAGVRRRAWINADGELPAAYSLNPAEEAELTVDIPARAMKSWIIRAAPP